jgi:hypothetical protein
MIPPDQLRRLSSAASERRLVVAAVAFVEGVAHGWGAYELASWFDVQLVGPGFCLRTPEIVHQAPVGSVAIHPDWARAKHPTLEPPERLGALLAEARARVVSAMSRLLPPTCDDGFMHAAIHTKRVSRRPIAGLTVWAPCVDESDDLSDVVLAFLAADVLTYRESYEALLCVCARCGRISFAPDGPRTACLEHR